MPGSRQKCLGSAILKEYYQIRGWTPECILTKAKLNELKMGEVAAELNLAV
jgi:aldehyde:ferredoxin oxidoreductase